MSVRRYVSLMSSDPRRTAKRKISRTTSFYASADSCRGPEILGGMYPAIVRKKRGAIQPLGSKKIRNTGASLNHSWTNKNGSSVSFQTSAIQKPETVWVPSESCLGHAACAAQLPTLKRWAPGKSRRAYCEKSERRIWINTSLPGDLLIHHAGRRNLLETKKFAAVHIFVQDAIQPYSRAKSSRFEKKHRLCATLAPGTTLKDGGAQSNPFPAFFGFSPGVCLVGESGIARNQSLLFCLNPDERSVKGFCLFYCFQN